VFARLPELRVVVVEAGFAWVPSVAWRLDRHWARMRDEVPHLTRPPSEYMRENMWFTTQPMDEPERTRDIRHILDWIGWDRVLFASDYPHWDMDSPELGFKLRMTPEEKRMIYGDNARAVYGLA
jgi:predicted TIM-barrel fold metal-dependent hydrolase